jgi:proline dehydrogenase
MMRSAMLAVTNRKFTRKMITDTRAGKAVAHRFVAGSTLEEAVDVARNLNADGLKVSMDYLGEHVASIEEADAATASYVACVDEIRRNALDANVSIKLTQLGMGLENEAAARNLDAIAQAAHDAEITVTVDMEESEHTETTISLYEVAQSKHGNLGIAIQAYLHRSPADIERIAGLGGHIRLCKGAYAEPAEIAFQGKAVDDAYDGLAKLLMQTSAVIPAIATHDDERIAVALSQATTRSEPWEFQMLYGVRRDRQVDLASHGHDMRVYVPYGEAWYPYLTRRMAERPANVGFFLRALAGK